MIAVVAKNDEQAVVQEFFELFKTPWEFHHEASRCEVLLCSALPPPKNFARLVLIFGSEENSFDREKGIAVLPARRGRIVTHASGRIPIYGNSVAFQAASSPLVKDEATPAPVSFEISSGPQCFVRIGYDLFEEIRHLLTQGQPSAHAEIPTLEWHIALLRDLITSHSIPLVEIPAAPAGYKFIACLTHDVDHVGVRNHKFDHTMFGFLYRATLGSILHFLSGKKSAKQVAVNFRAALSLPLVHLGWAKDFWYQFEHYRKIESGLVSTFFVIPKKGEPGLDKNGRRQKKRAAQYDAAELQTHLQQLQSTGCEIGVHGIDAWRDSQCGTEEMKRISGLIKKSELGVRMHWLFFDEQSPGVLEKAGFDYDSTVGYNDTVGYRAGTTQVFKPLSTEKLLELPMHIMDTALFYPAHLNLSFKKAEKLTRDLIQKAMQLGGVLTINWHDRSIAPERLWDEFYIKLLQDLKTNEAWFATGSEATAWFRKRRSARIENFRGENGVLKFKTSIPSDDTLPPLRIRIHRTKNISSDSSENFVDLPFQNGAEISLAV